jgi:hypothetical protein
MSDLKYLNKEELEKQKSYCQNRIRNLNCEIAGLSEKIKWINNYIEKLTPKQMSLSEIEEKLGHKVVVTDFARLCNIDGSQSDLYMNLTEIKNRGNNLC